MSSPAALMGRLIREGASPDEAAAAALTGALGDEVLACVGQDAREWLYGLALREARHLEGRHVNARMKRVLGRRGLPGGTPRHDELAATLRVTVYRLPDGARVLWDGLTVDLIEAKIAALRKQVGAVLDHVRILEAARDLMAERDAGVLGDIPGWAVLVRKMAGEGAAACYASGEVQGCVAWSARGQVNGVAGVA